MKIFPNDIYDFKINNQDKDSIERLIRRTEKSETLYSKSTDKSFIGEIKENAFRIISSESGFGALVVLSGNIENGLGQVSIEINRVFKIFILIFYLMPIFALVNQIILEPADFLMLTFVSILQILMIRFFFIEFIIYRRNSKRALNRLSDVLDIEWIKKKPTHNKGFVQ